ncbi:Lipopolysaccharide assembly protein A [compost metagenome]
MRNFKRFLLVLLLLIIATGVLAFALENQQPVGLVFLGWSLPELPVSIFILAALIAGLTAGPLLSLLFYVRRRSHARHRISSTL